MSAAGDLLFVVCSALAVGTAIATVASKRPLRAAMSLLFHILSLAGLYLTLHAQFLAVLQLLVYAAAVVVLFVFVIMLIGPDAEQRSEQRRVGTRLVALSLGAVMTGLITFAVMREDLVLPVICGADPACTPAQPTEFGGVDTIGRILYGSAVIPFELVGVLLLVAIVGAVAVARGRSRQEEEAAAQRRAALASADAAQAERERRLSAEVAAHGGH